MKKVIESFNCIQPLKIKRPIVLFSGGLDSTYLITYLKKELNINPIALRVNVGQSDLENVSLINQLGVHEYLHEGLKEFTEGFINKSIQNGGRYGDGHYLSASLTRPFIAQVAYNLALKEGSNCILHSAVPTQNSLRRFNNSLEYLNFEGYYGSPFSVEDLTRDEKIQYLHKHGIKINKKRVFSFDTNIWCREFEAGNLENVNSFSIPETNFLWTKPNDDLPNIKLSVSFTNGILTHINDKECSLIDGINFLNKEVGKYGIGRQVSIEEGPISKVIEARECPAAHILIKSIYHLMSLKFSRDVIERKLIIDQRWATLACEGHWFSTEKKAIESYNKTMLKDLTGTVSYDLSHGHMQINGIYEESVKVQQLKAA
jgi:argininosuccinate synthase